MRLLPALLSLMAVALPAAAQDRVVAYEIVNGREIPESLSGQPGDAEAGRKLYFDRALTGCSGCHGSPGGPGAEAGDTTTEAPSLAGLSARMSVGTIRLWLVAPQLLQRHGGMPGYYSLGQRTDPADPRYGETQLSAQEIEDIVAYLMMNR